MKNLFSLFIFRLLRGEASDAAGNKCFYGNCHEVVPDKLNVHLVPHTHDDVGWLKTVDQYYYGSNDTIKWANAGVQYILDTVVPNLLADPSKRFIFVETAYFWRWWEEQEDLMKDNFRRLVETGQLEFILGGWCMNDEATVHYTGMIQQLSLGVRYLSEVFGAECGQPRVGWQIDPFGHSKTQAEVFALAGFDGLFFGRADYQDKAQRQKDRRMEFLWQTRSSGSFNVGSLFSGLNENGYNPPPGFCFDWVCEGDQPIMDDKRLHDYNVDDVIRRFKIEAEKQRAHFRGNNIMMTMGSDFQYRNAFMWYKNMDKLIKYVNGADVGLNLIYSTPSCYLKAKNNELDELEEVVDDFFPYADGPHMFWTGYFTSRAALKRYVRESNVFLSTCKLAQVHLKGAMGEKVEILERAFAVAQHHDAVSGTERQHVAADYAQRLFEGRTSCTEVIQAALGEDFSRCDYLNISVCDVSTQYEDFDVVVINPGSLPTAKILSIPINYDSNEEYEVTSEGRPLVYQISSNLENMEKVQLGHSGATKHQLNLFTGQLEGFSIHKIKISSKKHEKSAEMRGKRSIVFESAAQMSDLPLRSRGRVRLTVGANKLELDRSGIRSINGIIFRSQCHIWAYASSIASDQASGAYIFRPSGSHARCVGKPKVAVSRGRLFTDVRLKYSSWAEQRFRFFEHHPLVEHEFIVGELPHPGMELIFRLDTKLSTGKSFTTDTNGRGELLRTRDYRKTWKLNQTEEIAGNYYPVTSKIRIVEPNGRGITIFPDRAQGGSSLKPGAVELMVLRETIKDDGRGVDEPLNDPGQFGKGLIVQGKHLILFTGRNQARANPHLGIEEQMIEKYVFNEPWIGFKKADETELRSKYFANLSMPKDARLIAVTSLEFLGNNTHMMRLEHLCAPGQKCLKFERAETFDFAAFYGETKMIKRIQEMNIIGNMEKTARDRLVWPKNSAQEKDASRPVAGNSVVISPTELRTFIIEFE